MLFGLLQAKAIANGHKLGTARIVDGHGGRGFMARCQVPACGASIWERPDLMGGHGAGPAMTCPDAFDHGPGCDGPYNCTCGAVA